MVFVETVLVIQTGQDLSQFIFPPGLMGFKLFSVDQGNRLATGTGNANPIFAAGQQIVGCFHPAARASVDLTQIKFQAVDTSMAIIAT